MEIRVKEMLEAEDLPGAEFGEGVEVSLSESLTQVGHDVEVMDASGEVVGGLQVKAGEWSGTSGRIDEYAGQGIPVAVTSESAAEAEAAGRGADVIDTGLSGADLTAEAEEIIGTLSFGNAVDELVPEAAGLILLATAALRLRAGEPLPEVKQEMTNQLTDLGVANAAAITVELMTGLIVLRPVTALGAKWTLGRVRTAGDMRRAIARQRVVLREGCATPPSAGVTHAGAAS